MTLQSFINRNLIGIEKISKNDVVNFFVDFDKNILKVNSDKRIDLEWVKNYLTPFYNFSYIGDEHDLEVGLIISHTFFNQINDFIKNNLTEPSVGTENIKFSSSNLILLESREDYFIASQKISEGEFFLKNFIYFNSKTKKALLFCGEYKRETNYLLVRTIRSLLNLSSLLSGTLHLHASGVALDSDGIIFIGDKLQGKTTSWLVSCINGGMNYISNDHITIKKANKKITGVPTSVGIRVKTLNYFDIFSDYVENRKEPNYLFQESSQLNDKKVYFLVKELIKELGVKIKNNCNLKLMIFPVYKENISFAEAKKLKIDDVLSAIGEFIIDDPCEHMPLWRIFHKDALLKKRKEQLSCLKNFFSGIDIYQIRYNEKLFEEFPLEIKRILDYNDSNKKYLFRKAEKFIKQYHVSSLRKDGRPLNDHLYAVVKILEKNGFTDKYLLTLALLHDVLEESEATERIIMNNFGKKLYRDVYSLTIIKRHEEKFDSEMKRMKKKLIHASQEALMVKAADRLHNLDNMEKEAGRFKTEKISRYKKATKEILEDIIIPKVGNNKITDYILKECK